MAAVARLFRPPPHIACLPEPEVRRLYPRFRWQILESTFIGTAQGKGLGWLAEHYGWDSALYATLSAALLAIVLLAVTWKLTPLPRAAVRRAVEAAR